MGLVSALARSNLANTAIVLLLLAASVVVTGIASSAYHRQRATLGDRHFQGARTLDRTNNEDGAVEEYRKALLFSPDRTEYRLALGEALIRAGRFEEAKAHLDQLAEDDPTNRFVNIALGDLAIRQQRWDDAIENYQRAVYQFWPPPEIEQRRQIRWRLVGLLDQTRHRSQATGELLQLYASAQNDAERAETGLALLAHGAISEGRRVFVNLEKTNPKMASAHRGLALADFDSEDYVRARHEFQHALALDPKDTEASAGLKRTNALIDMDPTLPNLSAAERIRRSGNLLKRVLELVASCAPADQIAAAQNLLNDGSRKDPDINLTMQNASVELWDAGTHACHVQDDVVPLVISRVRND